MNRPRLFLNAFHDIRFNPMSYPNHTFTNALHWRRRIECFHTLQLVCLLRERETREVEWDGAGTTGGIYH